MVEKPVKKLLKAVGLKRVRKTYKEFEQEVVHSKVTFTADSYRAEKIVPCPDGQHDIMDSEQPVEIYFEDGVKIIQDRYCRKCGQHSSVKASERMNSKMNHKKQFQERSINILQHDP